MTSASCCSSRRPETCASKGPPVRGRTSSRRLERPLARVLRLGADAAGRRQASGGGGVRAFRRPEGDTLLGRLALPGRIHGDGVGYRFTDGGCAGDVKQYAWDVYLAYGRGATEIERPDFWMHQLAVEHAPRLDAGVWLRRVQRVVRRAERVGAQGLAPLRTCAAKVGQRARQRGHSCSAASTPVPQRRGQESCLAPERP